MSVNLTLNDLERNPLLPKQETNEVFFSTVQHTINQIGRTVFDRCLPKKDLDKANRNRIQMAFQENFFKRVPLETRDQWIEQLIKYETKTVSREVLIGLKKCDPSIFREKNWEVLAIHCYLRGLLNKMEISKLFLYQACAGPHFEVHSLNDSKSIQILAQGLARFDLGDLAEKISAFARKPKMGELQFFSYQDNSFRYYPKKSIFGLLSDLENDIFISSKPIKEGIELFIGLIIPPDLLYELCKLIFGEHAAKPDPVLGYNPEERMDDPHARIVCIPCPGVDLPAFVHEAGSTARGGMYVHDALHLFYDSANMHREIWCDLAIKFSHYNIGPLFDDRAFTVYLQGFHGKLYGFTKPRKETWPYDFRFWSVLEGYFTNSNYSKHASEVYQYVLSQESKWGSRYNISYASLERLFQHKYRFCDSKPYFDEFLIEHQLERFKR